MNNWIIFVTQIIFLNPHAPKFIYIMYQEITKGVSNVQQVVLSRQRGMSGLTNLCFSYSQTFAY